MPESRPGIGLVVDRQPRAQALRAALMRSGMGMAFCGPPGDLNDDWAHASRSEVEAWVVDLSEECDWPCALENLIGQIEVPVLISDADPELVDATGLRDWAERLLVKVGDMLVCVQSALEQPRGSIAPDVQVPQQGVAPPGSLYVWVLAASLGGPQAVKKFLDTLPAGVPAAFVYAQHTDRNFQSTLSRLLGRHSGYEMVLAEDGLQLRAGLVVMLPVDQVVEFDLSGKVQLVDHAWPGPYTPCIDLVVSRVAEIFAPNAGVIVFSGMGEDGSAGARKMAAQGGEVWIQDPSTCACYSMPEEAAKAAPGGYRGNPEHLARHLAASMKRTSAPGVRASTG